MASVGHRLQVKTLDQADPRIPHLSRTGQIANSDGGFPVSSHLRWVHGGWPNLACSRPAARSTSCRSVQDGCQTTSSSRARMAVQASSHALVGQFPADQFGKPGQLGGGRGPLQAADSRAAGRPEEVAAGHCRQSSCESSSRSPAARRSKHKNRRSRSGSVCGQRQAWTPSPASACTPGVVDPIVPARQLPIGPDIGRAR